MGDKIKTYVPSAVILQLNNERLRPEETSEAFIALESAPGVKKPWKKIEGMTLEGEPAALQTILKVATEEQRWRKLADFEEHLEDVSRDFLNRNFQL